MDYSSTARIFMMLIGLPCFLLSSALDVVSGNKPSPSDTAELLDPVENQVTPLLYPSDFGTVPSETMNIKSFKRKLNTISFSIYFFPLTELLQCY